jgi:hypothetical protein
VVVEGLDFAGLDAPPNALDRRAQQYGGFRQREVRTPSRLDEAAPDREKYGLNLRWKVFLDIVLIQWAAPFISIYDMSSCR